MRSMQASGQEEGYGVSLRDRFALAALQGILASAEEFEICDFEENESAQGFTARMSYAYADAMLKERNKV